VERRLAAILAGDVAGCSRLTSTDEEDTDVRSKEHLRVRVLIDPKITDYHGRFVKNTGDGMLAEYSSVVDAVRCAVEVPRGMAERNASRFNANFPVCDQEASFRGSGPKRVRSEPFQPWPSPLSALSLWPITAFVIGPRLVAAPSNSLRPAADRFRA
jgi:hypothetical protein